MHEIRSLRGEYFADLGFDLIALFDRFDQQEVAPFHPHALAEFIGH